MSIHQEPEAKKISNSSSKPAKGAFSQQPAFAALPETETTKNKIPEQTQRIKERSDDSFEKINTYADTPTSSQPRLLTKPLESVIQLETQNEELQDVQTKPLAGVIQREAEAEEELQEVQTKQIQAKVVVGAPGDKYEQEADNMAAKVIAMPDSVIQQSIGCDSCDSENKKEDLQMKPLAGSITPLVQRQEEPEEEQLQMKRTDSSLQTGGNLESQLNSTKGGGTPLSEEVRSFMEPRFGADFSQVRVHTDNEAVQMNRDLNAQAFTHQQDVYFGAGKAPRKDALTAHELTHVVQQTGKGQFQLNQNSLSLQRKCLACEEKESIQRTIDISHASIYSTQHFDPLADVREQNNTERLQRQESYTEISSVSPDSLQRVAGVDDAAEAGLLLKVLMNCVLGVLTTVAIDEGIQIGTWAWKKWWKKQDVEFRQDWCKTVISALFGCVFGIAGGAFERMFFAEAAETTGKGLLIWIARKAKILGYTFVAGNIGQIIAKAGCASLHEDVSSLRTVE